MGILVNYDLDSKHTIVKDAMKAIGYQDYFEQYKNVDGILTKKRVNLPNTTLYNSSRSVTTGTVELKAVAESKGAIVEQILTTNFNPSSIDWSYYG